MDLLTEYCLLLSFSGLAAPLTSGSDAANIEVRWLPDFSCQVISNLGRSGSRWVDSILDGHFVAGYRIWERVGKITI